MAKVGPRPGSAALLLLGCIVAQFAGVGLPRYAYPILLPDMRDDLALSYFESGFVATGNFVGFMVAAFSGGLIAVRIGARRTIYAALALCTVAMLACAASSGYLAVLVAQTVVGLGSGALPPTVIGLVAQWVGSERRGLAIGAVLSAMGMGVLATGVALPVLLARAGWREGWLALGGIGLVALIVALATLRESPLTARGVAAGGLRAVYGSWRVWYYCLLGLATGSSNAVYTTFFAAWLVTERGMSVSEAGWLWSLAGMAAFASSVAWGGLSDRIGWGRALTLMFATQALAIGLFTAPSGALIAVSGLLFGATLMGYQVIAGAALTRLVPERLAPAGQSLSVLMFAVGQAIGPAVAGRAADVTGTLAPSFLGAAAVALLGAIAALFAPRESGSRL
jgi:predicted MFS family arabinose efflux permease